MSPARSALKSPSLSKPMHLVDPIPCQGYPAASTAEKTMTQTELVFGLSAAQLDWITRYRARRKEEP